MKHFRALVPVDGAFFRYQQDGTEGPEIADEGSVSSAPSVRPTGTASQRQLHYWRARLARLTAKKVSFLEKEYIMTRQSYGQYFVIKSLVRVAIAALVLSSAAANAQGVTGGPNQGQGSTGNQYNGLAGGGG
jgi:hypothetical protein